jgi:hypothetical protein
VSRDLHSLRDTGTIMPRNWSDLVPSVASSTCLGSGLVDQSQKMTVAASAMAEKKTVGHRS